MRTIDFNEKKTHAITYDELKSTALELLPGDKPLHGMHHVHLISQIMTAIQLAGYEGVVKEIYVSSAGPTSLPGISAETERTLKYGELSIPSYTFRRIIAQIDIPSFDRGEIVSSVVIAYHQKGIELGFGPKVHACSNMCIMSPQFSVASFGREDKVDVEKMITIFKTWMGNLGDIAKKDDMIIDTMKNTIVHDTQIRELIGDMTLQRVGKDKFRTHSAYGIPFNQSQIGQFCEGYLKFSADHNNPSSFQLWDVYNIGTELHKADRMDFENLISQNLSFGRLLLDYFKIDTTYDLNKEFVPVAEVVSDAIADAIIIEEENIPTTSMIEDEDDW